MNSGHNGEERLPLPLNRTTMDTQSTLKQNNMDKIEKTTLVIVTIVVAISIFILGWGLAEMQWKHYAIAHHSAFYEADSWGQVSFHWNDDSLPQTPFQDQTWEKIQASIFQKKLDTLGIK
jgi:hypothetical protein